jgi:hypothetical protein
MKVIIVCVLFFYYTLYLMLPFIIVISCEGLILLPLTSKGVYKDNYLQFNSSTTRVYSKLLIKFANTSQKVYKN